MDKKEKRPFPHKTVLMILTALLGISLLLLGSTGRIFTQNDHSAAQTVPKEDSLTAYTRAMEEKIACACEKVAGVSHVTVLINLDSDFENVYATDEESTQNGTAQQSSRRYVTTGSGTGEAPVLLTRTLPHIAGIGVICEGGDDPRVRAELTALLSATFDIGANKISIVAAKVSD